jgi:TonB family protein
MSKTEQIKSNTGDNAGSSLDYMTGIKSDNTLLKKSFIASVCLHLLLLWVVFPSSGASGPEKVQEEDFIFKKFTPPPPKKQEPKKRKVMVKRSNVVIPDPDPDTPEPAQQYVWDEEEDSAMDESDWVFDPGGDQGPIRAGVKVKMPECYDKKLPIYPDLARKARIKGVVVLNVIIDTNGRIRQARVISSPGKQFGFDDAALSAVREWRCYPATLDGRKVEITGSVTVNFLTR